MRDLYNRRKRLADWIKRVNEDVDEPDRTDILKLIEHMQDKERAILWIVRCITALITLRKPLGKPFRNATKDDIRSILKWMEQKNYKASTNEKFRQVLKLFYKTVYGNNEYYPEQVKWFSSKVGKEKAGKETNMDMAKYLEEEEILKLIESAPTLQSKAFLACMYESGARPEEFLRLTNTDIRIDSKGAVFMLRGKTGERRVDKLQATRQHLSNDIEDLKYKISLLDKITFSSKQDCKRTEQQLQELTAQKDRLEKWIANISNNDELKQVVKENVKVVLSENKRLISTAFAVMIQTLKTDPQLVNLIYVDLIYSAPSANDGEQNKDDNNYIANYLESNKDRILELAEKNFENLVEALTNNAIATASSNPTLSLPQSSSTFNVCPDTQSDIFRKEDPGNYHNSKGDIAN